MNTVDDTGGARPGAIRGPLVVTNRHRWAIVGLLFTASLINYFDRATIAFALPLISRDLHLGPEAKGVLLSAFFWSYALMQIPMGVLADRVNLRWLYAVAFALWSVSQGLIGLATGLGTLIAFRVLLGVGEAFLTAGVFGQSSIGRQEVILMTALFGLVLLINRLRPIKVLEVETL